MLSSFANLPARPPTPPRDVSKDVDNALRFLREGHEDTASDPSPAPLRPSTNTPPPRSPASSQTRSSANTKKVDFSPWPTYHNIPRPGQLSSPAARSLKQTPLRHETKPLKSILKPASEPLPPTPDDLESKLSYFSPQEPGSFRKMLQSVLNQLASTSRDERRDAYLALTGSLKMYEGVPEPQAIIEKIGLIQQFICRDIQWKGADGQLDSTIIQQAAALAGMLVFNPHVGPAFDNDFRIFLVDRSTAIIEQSEVSKAIVKNHMYLMAQQRFSPAVMTAARADRLINAVQGIEDRCVGNSLISARLLIFQRLLETQPNTMLHRMRDWIEHLFHGMLSSVEDIRVRAIDTCSCAGLRLGTQISAVKIVLEVLNKTDEESEDGQTYGDYFNLQLMQMTGQKDRIHFVPQIWGAIILLFRCKKKPIERWPKFRNWLLCIQKCLNSGDLEVKHKAAIAWNKLVFSVMPDSATSDAMRSMLGVPTTAALEKRGNDRHTQQSRQIGMDSYCNLLHYGLRPSLNHDELDTAWNLYVEPVLSNMVLPKNKSQYNACRVLHGLLMKSNGIWNPNAAIENRAIKPEDLPRLDPRWIRTRLAKVIKILEPILVAGMWMMPDSNRAADSCWKLLMQAIAEAGSQEVKTSNELKDAIAQITNLLRRIWSTQTAQRSEAEGSVWIHRYQSLLEQAVESLGSSHFVEDILAKTETDEIEAAPTPSHRLTKHVPVPYPAFVFLFALYYHPGNEIKSSGLYKDSAAWFLRLLGNSKPSSSSNVGLLHRSLKFASDLHTNVEVSCRLWNAVAESTINAMKVNGPASGRDAQIMGIALSSALSILIEGLSFAQFSNCKAKALELYATICQSAKHYGHEGGVALGVMEPLAKSLNPKLDELSVPAILVIGKVLMENGVWPKNRQELDQSRKALWAISLELRKTPVFDPFEHVYTFFNGIMDRAYKAAENEPKALQALPGLLRESVQFLRRCPPSTLSVALRQVQGGFAIWAEDRQRYIFPLSQPTSDAASRLTRIDVSAIVEAWSDVLRLVEEMPRKDSSLLQALEPLVIAGLSSPSKEIVNSTISFWNSTFGEEENFAYPSRVLPVLRARRAETELRLPGLTDDDDAEIANLPAFAESQLSPRAVSDFAFSSSPRVSSDIRKKPLVDNFLIKQHLAAQGLPYDEPRSSSKRSSGGKQTKTKLRHDDSQIDFAPIESSSPQATPDESQLLTERQREVKARQRGDAQMFPDISSSPNAQRHARQGGVAKRLNFTPDVARDQEGEIVTATPPAPVDGNPMSDDLPSSPTPRAATGEKANKDVENYSDVEDDNETIVDPPSSPPQREASPAKTLPGVGPDDTTVVESTAHDEAEQETTALKNGQSEYEQGEQDAGQEDVVAASDLPSDTLLPAEQLEREAAEAAAATSSQDKTVPSHTAEESNEHQAVSEEEHKKNQWSQSPSRIQDSMIHVAGDDENATPTASQVNTPASSRRSRKRKRAEAASSASQSKRSKPSPFKRFFSTLVGSQPEAEEEEEEDIGDEIVVAGSRARTSPLPKREPVDEPSTILNSQEVTSAIPEKRKPGRPKKHQSEAPKKAPVEAPRNTPAEAPRKRKPGRPRKSESQLSSQSDVSSYEMTGSKRRASAFSTASAENQSSVNVVKETPAPAKARKSARLSQDTDAGSSSRKLYGTPHTNGNEQQREGEQDEREEEHASPENQLVAENSAVPAGRLIAQPKSILDRLRGVLGDCRKMVFGSVEEERQFDDVLFEIRREVHEAGRRARE